MVIRRIDPRSGAQQQPGRIQVVPVRRPVQRRRAIALGQVDVRSAGHESFRTWQIAQPDGLDQRQFGWRGRGGNSQKQKRSRDERRDATTPVTHV